MKKYFFLSLVLGLTLSSAPTVYAADCWCAVDGGACSKTTQTFATTAECNAHCNSIGSVSRHFDTGHTYTAASGNNMCGNYCWCQLPPTDGQTAVRCENHTVSNRIVTGKNFAMVNAEECTAYCQSRGGTSAGFENDYHPQRNPADCRYQSQAPAGAQAGSGTTNNAGGRSSTPAPTVRLFNPLAGASTVVDVINRVIKMMLGLVGAGALLMFIYGGIKWMTAGGDATSVSNAQSILKNATLGLLLITFSYTIVSLFFNVLR